MDDAALFSMLESCHPIKFAAITRKKGIFYQVDKIIDWNNLT